MLRTDAGLIIVNGGADGPLPKCTSYLNLMDDSEQDIDQDARNVLSNMQNKFSHNVERVLTLC